MHLVGTVKTGGMVLYAVQQPTANADSVVVMAHGHFLVDNTIGMDAGELVFSHLVLRRRLLVAAFLALLTPPNSQRG